MEKSKTFCRVENVKSGLIAMALDLPKVSSHSKPLIFSDLGFGPSLEEIASSSGKRAENSRLAGQQADAWVMQHWAGSQETKAQCNAQCSAPFQGKGSFLNVQRERFRRHSQQFLLSHLTVFIP